MRKAIVDLGTNTFNLLIADCEAGTFNVVLKDKYAVKLGKSGINSGVITSHAFKRGVVAMNKIAHAIQENEADQTIAVATSAMRDASNSQDFVDEVYNSTGIAIKIISGEEEAHLIHDGASLTVPPELTDYVIMDIGGGSTEFVIVVQNKVVWSNSYDIGVSRLLDWLNPSNPIMRSEIETLTNKIRIDLNELYLELSKHKIKKLVGTSGTFDSLHDMLFSNRDQQAHSSNVLFSSIPIANFNTLYKKLVGSTLEERLQIKGLVSMRADMIVISSIKIYEIINNCDIQELYRSSNSLKEGLLVSSFQNSSLE